MKYSLVQASLEIPEVESLKRAFRSIRSLTNADAHGLANDAFGILVKNLSETDAWTLHHALHGERIATEVVPHNRLPPLPPARFLNRMDCLPEHLRIYDPLGRGFPVEWNHLMLIAAGEVQTTGPARVSTERRTLRFSGRGAPSYETVRDVRYQERLAPRLFLQVIFSRGAAGYQAEAARFNFAYLGERRKASLAENLGLVIQDLARFAPQAALNRGAHYLSLAVPEVFAYPSRNAFQEEIIWMLHQWNKSH